MAFFVPDYFELIIGLFIIVLHFHNTHNFYFICINTILHQWATVICKFRDASAVFSPFFKKLALWFILKIQIVDKMNMIGNKQFFLCLSQLTMSRTMNCFDKVFWIYSKFLILYDLDMRMRGRSTFLFEDIPIKV